MSDPQLPCRCGNEDPSLFAPVGGERACLLCAYAERRAVPDARQRVLDLEAAAIARSDSLPAAPFALWLRRAALTVPWEVIVDWSGWHDKGLREVRDGKRRVVPTDAVDRTLSWHPSGVRLDDLYDLDALWSRAA